MRLRPAPALALLLAALAGCSADPPKSPPAPSGSASTATAATAAAGDEVAAERAKLAPEGRALVEAQEWCAVSTDERLGAMGPPLRLDIKGEPVFVCCKGCKRKAEADPDKTLKVVAELKAKKASGAPR